MRQSRHPTTKTYSYGGVPQRLCAYWKCSCTRNVLQCPSHLSQSPALQCCKLASGQQLFLSLSKGLVSAGSICVQITTWKSIYWTENCPKSKVWYILFLFLHVCPRFSNEELCVVFGTDWQRFNMLIQHGIVEVVFAPVYPTITRSSKYGENFVCTTNMNAICELSTMLGVSNCLRMLNKY